MGPGAGGGGGGGGRDVRGEREGLEPDARGGGEAKHTCEVWVGLVAWSATT